MDEFIEKYRWYLLGATVLVILSGVIVIWQNSSHRAKVKRENQEIAELKNQNEKLRQELSGQTQVLGANDIPDNSDKININSATSEELDGLPNIGPARAADIISYRVQNGGFKSIEEIKNIKGIGDKSFEDLKDLITVGN